MQSAIEPLAPVGSMEFLRFVSGQAIEQKYIEQILKSHGIQGEIRSLRYGYYKKIVAWLQGDEACTQVVKLAFHPYSIALLQKEAEGYEMCGALQSHSFCFPRYELVDSAEPCAIAVMEAVSGNPAKIWHFPRETFTRLWGVKESVPLAEYLRQKESALVDVCALPESWKAIVEKIFARFGNRPVPVSPSHGDFIYWNLLCGEQGESYLLDLEYFSRSRSACFDDWHWFLFPLARKAIKFKQEDNFISASKLFPFAMWNMFGRRRYAGRVFLGEQPLEVLRLLLVLYLYEQSLLFFREHQLPQILSLIGEEAYQSRERLQWLHLRMIEKTIS